MGNYFVPLHLYTPHVELLEEWGIYAVVPKQVARTSNNSRIFSGSPLISVMSLR